MPLEATFLEEGRILYYKAVAPVTSADMRASNIMGQQHFATVPFTVHVILDVRELKSITPDAMRLDTYRELRRERMGQTAIVGAHHTLRTIVNALTKALNYQSLAFFATEQEAMEWIHAAIAADKQQESLAS
jgi:SpoIIAA-like